jgi:phosphoribosyl-AMP cyclohydrolase
MSKSDAITGPDFAKSGGIVPAIVQDYKTGQVLMLAYMNEAAYRETLLSGRGTYFSRSRQKLWKKGEESGNVQVVREVYIDCDADAILLKVDQTGAACHEGYPTCFFRRVSADGLHVVQERLFDPSQVYRRE